MKTEKTETQNHLKKIDKCVSYLRMNGCIDKNNRILTNNEIDDNIRCQYNNNPTDISKKKNWVPNN